MIILPKRVKDPKMGEMEALPCTRSVCEGARSGSRKGFTGTEDVLQTSEGTRVLLIAVSRRPVESSSL